MSALKAIVYREYGDPLAVLHLEDVDEPTIGDEDVLVRVRGSSVNPADLAFVTGLPGLVRTASGLRRPRRPTPGRDLAGTVEAVGAKVVGLSVGDEVYGEAGAAYAQYARVRPGQVARKPRNLSFAQASCVPLAGLTAWQAWERVTMAPGARVVVNGASGGVGHFAVQIARARGADVTAICSAANADLVRSLGADRVLDYREVDYTTLGDRFDVVFDAVRSHPLNDSRRALAAGGTYLSVGTSPDKGPGGGGLLGPMAELVTTVWAGAWARPQRLVVVSAAPNRGIEQLTALIESGQVTPHLETTLPLADVPAALAQLATHRVRGKIAIRI